MVKKISANFEELKGTPLSFLFYPVVEIFLVFINTIIFSSPGKVDVAGLTPGQVAAATADAEKLSAAATMFAWLVSAIIIVWPIIFVLRAPFIIASNYIVKGMTAAALVFAGVYFSNAIFFVLAAVDIGFLVAFPVFCKKSWQMYGYLYPDDVPRVSEEPVSAETDGNIEISEDFEPYDGVDSMTTKKKKPTLEPGMTSYYAPELAQQGIRRIDVDPGMAMRAAGQRQFDDGSIREPEPRTMPTGRAAESSYKPDAFRKPM